MNIYGIAERAGVSIATVSRVLNGSPSVSAKTKAKVLAAMKEADYTPNIFARGLGLGSIKMIGVLCVDVADMYYASAVSALEKLLRAEEYDVLLYCTGETRAEKQRCIHRLLEKRVDAIITVGSAFMDNLEQSDLQAAAQAVPVILINASAEVPGVYSVLCDEGAATHSSVHALYRAGYHHLLYVYDCETPSGKAKRAGFQRAVDELGLAAHSTTLQTPRTVGEAALRVGEMLARHSHINGVLTSEDVLAVGALQALAQMQRKAPVIGFNNSLLAECTLPTLTSVDNMAQPLCTTAVTMLTSIFKGNAVSQSVMLAPRLVERDSFRCR